MVPRSFGLSSDLRTLGACNDRSVCDEVESPVAYLCLTGSRPRGLGCGRSVNQLGGLVGICLSSHGLGPENTSEVKGSELSDDSDRPSQLEQVLGYRSRSGD